MEEKGNKGEIVLYQPDGALKLDVRLEDETVWLTQAQMGQLFEKSRNTITEHIQHIFKEGELQEEVVCRDFRHTTQHGAIEGKMQIKFAKSHDRFLLIDNDTYHIGASLKDLGKKWFAFSKMQIKASDLLRNII